MIIDISDNINITQTLYSEVMQKLDRLDIIWQIHKLRHTVKGIIFAVT